jgi:hypothetical protein
MYGYFMKLEVSIPASEWHTLGKQGGWGAAWLSLKAQR